VGADGSVCFYDGATMGLRRRIPNAHGSTGVYSCSWDCPGACLLTCGADGWARLHNGRTGRGLGGRDLARLSLGNKGTATAGGAGAGAGAGAPAGSMQLGCAFVKGDVPVSVGYGRQIAILLPLLPPRDEDGVDVDVNVDIDVNVDCGGGGDPAGPSPTFVVTGHRAPISAMALGARRRRGNYAVYMADTDGVIVEWDGPSGRARGRVVPAAEGAVGSGWGGEARTAVAHPPRQGGSTPALP
jgi:hypothetical protein